jgi:hypothetical protein
LAKIGIQQIFDVIRKIKLQQLPTQTPNISAYPKQTTSVARFRASLDPNQARMPSPIRPAGEQALVCFMVMLLALQK